MPDDATLTAVRRGLLDRRSHLVRRRLEHLSAEQAMLDERPPDWEDQAANESAAGLLDRLSETEFAELSRINAAIDRIDRGTWGRCVVCGEEISAQRLASLPEADRCADCTNHR